MEDAVKQDATAGLIPTFLSLVMARFAAHGGDAGALLRPFSLRPDDLRSPTLPASTARRIVEAVAAELGDPHMGLHIAQAIPRGGTEYSSSWGAVLAQWARR
jgi:hypothetical protein